LSNLPHQTVEKLQQKTMGSSEDPQLGKQRRRARLGVLRVKEIELTMKEVSPTNFDRSCRPNCPLREI